MGKDQNLMSRIINGRRYIWEATRENKKDAQLRAKKIRKRGGLARIFKGRQYITSRKNVVNVYRVYVHDPKHILGEDWFPKKKK